MPRKDATMDPKSVERLHACSAGKLHKSLGTSIKHECTSPRDAKHNQN